MPWTHCDLPLFPDDIGNHNDISDDNGDIGDNENGDKRDLTCSHIRAASWLESGQQESMF